MANDPASLGGPFAGATPSEFFVDDDVKQGTYGPTYAGGKRGGLADYYRKAGQSPYASRIEDPFFRDWANQGKADQLSDRSQLMDAYRMAQSQGAGGVTPQQQAMQGGFLSAAQNAQNAAHSARGGAYGRSAAGASLTQGAGIQGAQNQQLFNAQKAADQLAGQQRQLQIATQLRAQDLQEQGMTADDAFNTANQEVQARGMNINRELGYAGLEGSAISGDYQQFLAALRRRFAQKKADQAQTDAAVNAGVQAGSSIAGAFASDRRAKTAAFASGVQTGRDLAVIDQDPNYQLIGSSRSKDLATYLNKRTGQVESIPMGFAQNPRDQAPAMPEPEKPRLLDSSLRGFAFPREPQIIRKNPFDPAGPMTPEQARMSADAERQKAQHMAAFAAPSPIGQHGVSPLSAQAQREASGLMGAYAGGPSVHAPSDRIGNPGMLQAGNIDLHNRPIVHNDDGSISTVRSMGVNLDGKEYLIPTVSNDGRVMGDDEAINYFRKTGQHLGVFDSPEASTQYAQSLHDDQAAEYGPRAGLMDIYNRALSREIPSANIDAMNQIVSDERAKEQAYLRGKLDGTRETTINMQAERDAGAGRGSKAAGELGVQKYAEGNIVGALQDFKNAPPGKVRDAQIRIAESKVSPNATSPSDARIAADRTLDKLSQSQSLYSYTHPSVDTNPTNPGAAHLGVMAQDLEQTPIGGALVMRDPYTDLRTINAPAGLSAAFAGLGRLNERTRALESRRR